MKTFPVVCAVCMSVFVSVAHANYNYYIAQSGCVENNITLKQIYIQTELVSHGATVYGYPNADSNDKSTMVIFSDNHANTQMSIDADSVFEPNSNTLAKLNGYFPTSNMGGSFGIYYEVDSSQPIAKLGVANFAINKNSQMYIQWEANKDNVPLVGPNYNYQLSGEVKEINGKDTLVLNCTKVSQ